MLFHGVVLSLLRSVAVLAALLATTRASAQPAPAPPSDESKIVNLASDPLGWILGLYGLGVSVALHDRIAIHADANYYQTTTNRDTSKRYELGLGVTLYPQRAFSGPLIEPGVRLRGDFPCRGCSSSDVSDSVLPTTTVGPELLVGWQCMIGTRFNVALAFGALYNVNHGPRQSAIEPDGYLRFGVAL